MKFENKEKRPWLKIIFTLDGQNQITFLSTTPDIGPRVATCKLFFGTLWYADDDGKRVIMCGTFHSKGSLEFFSNYLPLWWFLYVLQHSLIKSDCPFPDCDPCAILLTGHRGRRKVGPMGRQPRADGQTTQGQQADSWGPTGRQPNYDFKARFFKL